MQLTPDDVNIRRRCEQAEGRVSFMYRDHEGNVTVGVGTLLASVRDAQRFPFVYKSDFKHRATRQEIADEYARVLEVPAGRGWHAWDRHTSLMLMGAAINDAFRLRASETIDDLRRNLPDFDRYPYEAQQGLFDMVYNTGITKFKHKFVKFLAAVHRQDWRTAAVESHRDPVQVQESRNEETRALFLAAAAAVAAAAARR